MRASSAVVEREAGGEVLVVVGGRLQLEVGGQRCRRLEDVAAGERDVLRAGARGLLQEAPGGRAVGARGVDRQAQRARGVGQRAADDQAVRDR